ncbi:MAG: UDP-N-acetylmuramoyl-L-alanine--D-glutamate ligase [Alphaproteobacteria bacterium]|nr:UDP-N-acetylmuramoyl-L-alanine--D-glutamate ligase [Alphaproteobacteria bacterium]
MIPLPAYRGAEVGVMGLGRSGQAAAAALAAAGAHLHLWDDREELRRDFGDVQAFDPSGLDRLVWSPGIPHLHPRPHPLAVRADAARVRPEADISLLVEAMPDCRFVGVTGTNGKSTATALVGHALGRLGLPHAVGGNLGPAALGLPALGPGGVYVLELSSYQLALMARPVFDVAVLLNIAPDHLDRHGGMHGYAADKARIFMNRATAIVGVSDPWCRRLAERLRAKGRTVVATGDDGPDLPALPGLHNRRNAAAALAALGALGIERRDALEAMDGFQGLPHRMETVGEVAGVRYVNDSKATNPESAAFALASFERVRWIAGGQAKTDNLDAVRPWFGRIAKAYLIGASEAPFAEALAGHAACERLGDLDSALAAAHRDARPGETVLLAPAAASFDQWDSFEARGDAFREGVRELAGGAG